MKKAFYLLVVLFLVGACNKKAGPKIRYYKKDGVWWYTSKIYGYPDGKKKLAQVDKYKKQNTSERSSMYDLQESILYYELWPNYEWKFVSKKGFPVLKDGVSYWQNDSLKVPDNVIYEYFDKEYVQHIDVYKDGKRVPYELGRPDGHRTMQYMREKPGVYNWKDGKEYFEREFTQEEWDSHNKMNEYLNKNRIIDSTGVKKD